MSEVAAASTDASPAEPPAGGTSVSQAGEQRSARIESLRGLPALIVVAEHVFIISGARLGGGTGPDFVDTSLEYLRVSVFFFFALSGYLIFWPFARSYFRKRESLDLGQYALNRALRVLPLYLAVVVVMMLLRNSGGSFHEWVRFLTFTQNFSVNTAQVTELIDPPMWTMLLEVQFYVALPLVAFVLVRLSRGSIGVAAILLGIAAAVGIYLRLHLLRLNGPQGLLTGVSMPVAFYFFIPGMLLALARIAWERERPSWMRGALGRADVWILASLPLWIIAPLPIRNGFAIEQWDFLVGPAAFLVIGAVVLPLSAGALTRALDWKPLAAVGIASYSIYMWHYPIISALHRTDWFPQGFWLTAAIAAPLAIAVGLVSYQIIEAPFLRLRRQWAASSARQEASPPAEAVAATSGAAER